MKFPPGRHGGAVLGLAAFLFVSLAHAHHDGGAEAPASVADPAALERAAAEMAQAAQNFWAALSPEQRAKAGFALEDAERFNWHFIPRDRKGLTWNEMDPAQQALAHAFLASGLSSRGYQQVTTIMSLEQVLKDLEGGKGPRRDSGNYAFTVFGTPGPKSTWGWRFEGHHLSFNFLLADGRAVAAPVFMGSNPGEVRDGPRKGLRVLIVEEDVGRELIRSLDDTQRKRAVINATAPNEIVTGNSRRADAGPPAGIAAGDLTAAQQRLLMTLVENYAYRLRPELAAVDLQRIEQADFKKIHFAWAGGLEPGEGHYYRLHGPTFLVEFDNTQGHANHIHTVWRDPVDDFGEDLLKRHYAETKHGDQPDH